jgi:hypothetical protein
MALEVQLSPNPGAAVVGRVSRSVKVAANGVRALTRRVPGTVDATRTGANATAGTLAALPDSTLRWLTASSLGLSAGLFLAGRRGLAIAATVAPAVIVSTAIALRPTERPSRPSRNLRPSENQRKLKVETIDVRSASETALPGGASGRKARVSRTPRPPAWAPPSC